MNWVQVIIREVTPLQTHTMIPYQAVTIHSVLIHVFPNVSIHYKETQQHKLVMPSTAIRAVDSDALLHCWDVGPKIYTVILCRGT
jgi:hypothetical protein